MDDYVAIEAAYRSGDWVSVLEEGSVLNRKLARTSGANAQALRQRLELMLAHTHLYGLGNADAAQRHYQALLNQPVEASLRQMAEDGLRQCREQGLATASPSGSEPSATTPANPGGASPGGAAATPERPQQPAGRADRDSTTQATSTPDASVSAAPGSAEAAAAPWLVDLRHNQGMVGNNTSLQPTSATAETADDDQGARLESETTTTGTGYDRDKPLIAEVIEEPELLEVHQADPRLAEELELSLEPAIQATPQARGLGLAALAEAAQTELDASDITWAAGQQGTSAAADEPDPDGDLLVCLRLVRLR